ncbi:MAG: hypothetical protein WCT33_02655 [Patescibacteria group bacterium]
MIKSKTFSNIKQYLLIITLFVILTVVMTYPWINHMNSWVHDGADSYFIAWNLAWDVNSFQNNIGNIFNANIFYPHENTLAYSEHLVGTALLVWPILALTHNPILAYNIVTFIFFALGAYCMYLFMFKLTRNLPVSIISAIIFGFNPYRVIHFSQIHLQVIFFFPLILLILHRIFELKKNRDFIFLVLAYVALGYMSMHYLLMMAVVTVVFMVFYFAAIDKKMPDKKFIIKLILAFFLIILAILPVYYPYFFAHDENGYSRSYGMITTYSPTVMDYFSFSPLITKIVGFPNTIEKVLYTGFTVVILFFVSLYYLIKRRIVDQKTTEILLLYLLIGAVCVLLSFGILVRFTTDGGGVVGPYIFFYKLIPGFDGLRALGRFFIVVLLSISVVIGLGLNQMLKRIKKRFVYGAIIILIASLVMLEYLWVPPFQPVEYRQALIGDEIPEVYSWFAEQSDDSVILELPLDVNLRKSTEYMYLSVYHWKKMINGYSGFFPEDYIKLEKMITDNFTGDETQNEISKAGVKFIIVHFGVQSKFTTEITPEELDQLPKLRLIKTFGSDYVYEVI